MSTGQTWIDALERTTTAMFDPHSPDLATLTPALAVLTAMITPAVLILASGTLLGSTSSRLGRVVDRVRVLSPLHRSILLIFEARLAIYAVHQEMAFRWRRGQQLAPSELTDRQRRLVALASEDRTPS